MTFSVSVVVPLKDEARSIVPLLESLVAQTLPASEIICVDGGSGDDTVDLAKSVPGSVPLRVLEAGPALPGKARNVGAQASSCEWIAFIDGGVTADPHWLEALVAEARQSPGVDAVFGNVRTAMHDHFQACATVAYLPPPRSLQRGLYRGPSIASCLIRRSVCLEDGGFPEHLRSAEDLVFIDRLLRDCRTAFAPEAVICWELAPTLSATFRRSRVYSASGLQAGTFDRWHSRILRRYALLAFTASFGFVGGAWAFWLPAVLIPGFVASRAAVYLYRYRPFLEGFRRKFLSRLFTTTSILAAVDAGLFAGTFDWLLARGSYSAD